MDFLVEQMSENVVMIAWMSAGRVASTGLLRERMTGNLVPLLQRTQADTGIDGHVELSEEDDAQDGPLYVCCDKGEVALVYGQLAVLKVNCEGSLRTSGDGCAVGCGEQAALRRRCAGN